MQNTQLDIRRHEPACFIQAEEELPEMITKFNEGLWGNLVDNLTVHKKDNNVFILAGGMEMKT